MCPEWNPPVHLAAAPCPGRGRGPSILGGVGVDDARKRLRAGAPQSCEPIEGIDTLSALDCSGLATDQNPSEKEHEAKERITVVDAALSMLNTPSMQTDKASERLASLEIMEAYKAVDSSEFVPEQDQHAKRDVAEAHNVLRDLALTVVDTNGVHANKASDPAASLEASLEVVEAPGEGLVPGQDHSDKGHEAEKRDLVVDTTLTMLDTPFMQADKAAQSSEPIEGMDTLSALDCSGLATNQDSSKKEHEAKERIIVVDAALSILNTPSMQTDKASQRSASAEIMESSKAVDCTGFVPDQDQCAKHYKGEEHDFVRDLALTMVDITTPGVQADKDSYDGVPPQLLNRDHEQVASNEGERNSPMGVQDDGMTGAAGDIPYGSETPCLQDLRDGQASQQEGGGEMAVMQAPTDAQQEGGGGLPSLQGPRDSQPGEEDDAITVLQPEALPKCSTSTEPAITDTNPDQHPEPRHSLLASVITSSARLLVTGINTAATAKKLTRCPRLW
ncbi:hypothetical protein ABBQ38_004807 [Trebouxia sp. C0009 RCD-2024]